MSCFAVSRLAGRLKNNKEGSPDSAILTEITTKNVKAVSASKKGHNLPSVEILQEVPPPPPRESSMTPVPPSSPQCYQYYQYNYPSMPPSQQQRHMSPHRSCNGSVPPSPALSGVGCRSPSRQRKNTYSTLEVQNAALAAMKDEMLELASRFTRVTKERDYMEKALNRLQVSILEYSKIIICCIL